MPGMTERKRYMREETTARGDYSYEAGQKEKLAKYEAGKLKRKP